MTASLPTQSPSLVPNLSNVTVDTIAIVQRLSRRPSDSELIRRGFTCKSGNLPNSTTWFYNGVDGEYFPNLTIYENYGRGFGFRVGTSLPKLSTGQNLDLLDETTLHRSLEKLAVKVSERSGIKYDVLAASVARIDYASNFLLEPNHATSFLNRCQRLHIPRMPLIKDWTQGRTVYRGNKSRIIRIYDKSLEANATNNLQTIIRLEFSIPNEAAIKNFAKRMGFNDHKLSTLLSETAMAFAVDEMVSLLRIDSFDPDAVYSLEYFLEKTGNLGKARRCSSFAEAFNLFGPDFYELEYLGFSRDRYRIEMQECQKLGF